ncbi:MAG: DUF1826 domain-containing protein [Pseudobdellovibrionaceae bacterium]|nr:DUF1826 domain-containing protein [Pseudobdellovibrionaceae bacterium]
MSEVLVTGGVRELPRGLPSQLALAWNAADLIQIEEARKNLLVYFWQPSAAFGLALAEARLTGTLPEMRERFSLEGIHHYFAGDHGLLLNTLFMELKPCIDFIIQAGFGREFQLTLARPVDQMCPIFHVDKVSLRLIVTLQGPGTEWLANEDVDRKRLRKGSNHKVVREGALIQQLRTFQVGLMKGDEYPGNFGRGLVHRSPEPEPHAESRWFFRLDSFRKFGRR